jgi:hypothetical protein
MLFENPSTVAPIIKAPGESHNRSMFTATPSLQTSAKLTPPGVRLTFLQKPGVIAK